MPSADLNPKAGPFRNLRNCKLNSGTACIVAVLAIVVLQASLILSHEPSVDEWQALQIAVQSPDFSKLLENLRYEGHPPLWYLLLRGVSAVVGPYSALPVTALGLSLFTQYVILIKSPFKQWMRILLALSEFILFEYNTISRGYTLGVALTFAVLLTWDKKRIAWIPIILLPATEFFFGLFSIAFIWFRFRSNRIWKPGLIAWLVISLLSAWTVIPAHDFVSVYAKSSRDFSAIVFWCMRLSTVMFPFQGSDWLHWDNPPPAIAAATLWLPFLWMCFDETRGRFEERIALFAYIAISFTFAFWIQPLATRQMMLIGLLLIALQWRKAVDSEPFGSVFVLWLALVSTAGLFTAWVSFTRPFDTDREVVREIRKMGLEKAHWAVIPASYGQGISALTGIMFERIGHNCMQDMIRWNGERRFSSPTAFEDFLRQRALEHGRFYLLSGSALPSASWMPLIANIGPGYDGKHTYLYEIGPGKPPFDQKLPRCVPDMRPLSAKPLL